MQNRVTAKPIRIYEVYSNEDGEVRVNEFDTPEEFESYLNSFQDNGEEAPQYVEWHNFDPETCTRRLLIMGNVVVPKAEKVITKFTIQK